MKGIKVIKVSNVGSNPEEEEVEFRIRGRGLSHVIRDNPYMDLEFQDGKKVRYDTYYYGIWGDYHESSVDNVIEFSAWLSEQELSDEDVEALKSGNGNNVLIQLIDEYNIKKEETDENE